LTASTYLEQLTFLEEFHGHELLNRFHSSLVAQGGRMNRDKLVTTLVEALPEVYAANRAVFGTDDFLDLANGVRALAGLSRLP
jgi:hypothetical protein